MSQVVRKIISTKLAPAALGPYNQAVAVNDTLYISGQLGLIPETMNFAGEDVESQAKQVFANMSAILTAAGSSMKNVVKTTVLLADMNDFPKVNKIYESAFSHPFPARSTFQVACLPKNAKIEIEAVAILGSITDI